MGLIFISHSSRDELAAAALRDRLLQQGYSAEGSIFLDSDGSGRRPAAPAAGERDARIR
jgi:hypothetical protein